MLQKLIQRRRILILLLSGGVLTGSFLEKTTSLLRVVFFLVGRFLFSKFAKKRYFTGELFSSRGTSFMLWNVLGIVGFFVTGLFAVPQGIGGEYLLLSFIVGILIWIPVIVVTGGVFLGYGKTHLPILRQIFPYLPRRRKIYTRGKLAGIVSLLQTEPEAQNLLPESDTLITHRIEQKVISPLSLIKEEYRGVYMSLLGEHSGEKILQIESIKKRTHGLVVQISTEGSLLPQDLISSKVRAKIIEGYTKQGKLLRSLSYHEFTRTIHVQLYTDDQLQSELIRTLVQKIEMGYTDLDIRNGAFQYPEFKSCEIIDQDTTKNEIYTVKLTYSLPEGLSSNLLSSEKFKALNAYVRLPLYEHTIKPHEDTLDIYIQLATRDLSQISYMDFSVDQSLRIPLGFDLKYRKPVYMNVDPTTIQEGDVGFCPHWIISGSTGSGKSSFIKYMITQLLRVHTPETLRLFLVDPKVVSFSIFKDLPHLYAPIVSDAQKVLTVLQGLIKEVDKRYELLAKHNVEHIIALKKNYPELEVPQILVIIDEFADIIDAHDRKVKQDINLVLKRLGQKARAAGVHIILMTQRATSTNIDGEIKANFSGRISFRVASEGDSHAIIDDPRAAHIKQPGEGYALLGDSDQLVHFQSPYVSDEDIQLVMQQHLSKKLSYIDTELSEALMRKPLETDQVTRDLLSQSSFPEVSIGLNLESHQSHSFLFARTSTSGSREPTPHIIIAGSTNSGKSMFAKLLITQIMRSGTPEDVQLLLIDPKVVSFSQFDGAPHLYMPVVTEHERLLPTLQNLLGVIQQRYQTFKTVGVEHLTEYNQLAETDQAIQKIPSLVLVIDEFADLLDSYDFKGRQEIEKILKRFGQMARAAGVYMVLITQRATSKNIPGEIRTHFSGRVAFRMNSEADSFYILEEKGAEKLPSAGHFLYKTPDGRIRKGYAPMVSKDEIREIVNDT